MNKKPNEQSFFFNKISEPHLFAPKPIHNKLVSSREVAIHKYEEGKGIDFEKPTTIIQFSYVDLNIWVQKLFLFIDNLFSFKFKAFTQSFDVISGSGFYPQLKAAKKQLVKKTLNLVVPVYEQETWSTVHVRKYFKKQIREKLSNAFFIKAIIEFDLHPEFDPYSDANLANWKLIIDDSHLFQDNLKVIGPFIHSRNGDTKRMIFMVTTPKEIVRKTNGQYVTSLSLHLDGTNSKIPTQNESNSDITINSFANSNPEDKTKVSDSLLISESFVVPLFQNTFSGSPILKSQSAVKTNPASDRHGMDEINNYLEWNYSVKYSNCFTHDEIKLGINFNAAAKEDLIENDTAKETDHNSTGVFIDAFAQIAQLIEVEQNLTNDLDLLLKNCDTETKIHKNVEQATQLLQTLCNLITNIAKVDQTNSNPSIPANSRAKNNNEDLDEYTIVLRDTTALISGVNALVTTIEVPDYQGIGIPVASLEGYTSIPYDPPQGVDFCYFFENKDGILSSDDKYCLLNRQIEFRAFNIIEKQNAIASIRSIRNRELVNGRPFSPLFVFTTPKVKFNNVLTPSLIVDEIIDISALKNSNLPKQTLYIYLVQFLEYIFSKNSQESLVFKMEVLYSFQPLEAPPLIEVPVIFIKDQSVPFQNGKNVLDDILNVSTDAIMNWFVTNDPSLIEGSLRFAITVFSTINATPIPIVEFTNLILPVKNMSLNG